MRIYLDMHNFDNRFLVLISRLNGLLGRQFNLRNGPHLTPVERTLYSIWVHHQRGDVVKRDGEFERMVMLISNLLDTKNYDIDLFRHFKRELNRAGITDSFFGLRFELAIAAMLIWKGINFTKTESPDYTISYNGEETFIECGSSRLRKPLIFNFEYKILSVINEKSGKPYANVRTALFIDVTNLLYQSVVNKNAWTPDTLRQIIDEKIKTTDYGAIALFCYMINRRTGKCECNYIRMDSSNINHSLFELLNEITPMGDHNVNHFLVPAEG